MGEIFARRAHAEGARRLILWDVDASSLEALAAELPTVEGEIQVQARVVDLRSQSSIQQASAQLVAQGIPHVLVNNAGVVTGRPFAEHTVDQISDIMAVNSLAPMYITGALLDAMFTGGHPARTLTMASAAALVSNPNMSVYAASKAAALSWSDSLRLELQRGEGRHIKVTTVCPTYVDTGMFQGAKRLRLTPILDPAKVADQAWKSMLRGTPLVLLPWTSKLGQLLRDMLPRATWDFLAEHALGIYHSMDHFTGRPPTRSERQGDESIVDSANGKQNLR